MSELIIDPALDLSQDADIELTDPVEIQRLLALLPKIIEKAEQRVQEADTALDNAKDLLEVEKAKAQLQAGERSELTAADDRKAWARTQQTVIDAEVEVINAKAQVKIAQLSANKYENYYTSVRKAANIFEVLTTAEMARAKYAGN